MVENAAGAVAPLFIRRNNGALSTLDTLLAGTAQPRSKIRKVCTTSVNFQPVQKDTIWVFIRARWHYRVGALHSWTTKADELCNILQ